MAGSIQNEILNHIYLRDIHKQMEKFYLLFKYCTSTHVFVIRIHVSISVLHSMADIKGNTVDK